MAYTVADLAKRVNGKVYGDGNKTITGVAGVETAGPNDIAFLLDEYAAQLPLVKAGAVLMTSAPEETVATTVIVTENPKWAFAELVDVLKPLYVPPVGIHPTAIVDATAEIDPQATILPYVVIGAGTVVKACAILHPHVVLGRDVTVGR
ncbi:MAG: LpxD N-terminal domain-containing protein, partial [Negativicoccus succinicivorans]|nr:LpxD N-terminal domain-containing protein [Negativicoccus succinicivorans]